MIRPARIEDLDSVTALALRSKAAWGYSAEFMEACREELAIREEQLPEVFVLDQNGEPIGFYSLQRLTPERAELGHLFVEPAEMRRGHGTTLLRDAVSRAREFGYRVLVIQGDPHAAGFYRAAGAHQVGSRESASIPGRMLPLFELNLVGAPPFRSGASPSPGSTGQASVGLCSYHATLATWQRRPR
jgi:GNAT superfamily N-acetyltransferase